METTRLTVTTEEAGQRADSLLARRLEGLTRSAAARLLEEGRVTDRGRRWRRTCGSSRDRCWR